MSGTGVVWASICLLFDTSSNSYRLTSSWKTSLLPQESQRSWSFWCKIYYLSDFLDISCRSHGLIDCSPRVFLSLSLLSSSLSALFVRISVSYDFTDLSVHVPSPLQFYLWIIFESWPVSSNGAFLDNRNACSPALSILSESNCVGDHPFPDSTIHNIILLYVSIDWPVKVPSDIARGLT